MLNVLPYGNAWPATEDQRTEVKPSSKNGFDFANEPFCLHTVSRAEIIQVDATLQASPERTLGGPPG